MNTTVHPCFSQLGQILFKKGSKDEFQKENKDKRKRKHMKLLYEVFHINDTDATIESKCPTDCPGLPVQTSDLMPDSFAVPV
jgi:hypothetical protein